MQDYTIHDLEKWDEKIRNIVLDEGLDCYSQEFELCSYEDMICFEAYVGMPSHYPHWSYGKSYERTKTLYQHNLEGLPYEMVINSDPCIAYLMRDNSLLLQILTMAHVYGHNDFFKNNRLFAEGTKAEYTVEKFKNHSDRIRSYIMNPSIGYEKVERILDAAHAIRFHTSRIIGYKELSREEQKEKLIHQYNEKSKRTSVLDEKRIIDLPNLNKIPLEPTEDILTFLIEYAKLEDWEKDIIEIVSDETKYFIPQIETKIMNEGWASYWHYKILERSDLPQNLHLEFLNRHNQVIRPFLGNINPYYVGFNIFKDIESRHGKAKLFEARKMERDQSFIRKYLTKELCEEMNLFQFAEEDAYVIKEISDEEGWKPIRDTLSNTVGMSNFPSINVVEVNANDNTLYLEHDYDGRELMLSYAFETIKYISTLWGGSVLLRTMVDNTRKSIFCNDNKKITLSEVK